VVNLAEPGCNEKIVAREDPDKWRFPDLNELWSGLPERPGNPHGQPHPSAFGTPLHRRRPVTDATHAPRHDLFSDPHPNPALDIATSTEQVLPTHKLRCGTYSAIGQGGINVARCCTAWALQ
jgi:hypothetical protein